MMISCSWFSLIDRYKSVYERLSSHDLVSTLIRIIVSMRFHHLISEIRLFHAHDLVWLVVTNRSMRDARESRFDSHIDINYCAHGNFTGHLNISPCFLSSYIFKLDDAFLWFGLVGGYKLVYEGPLSRVIIWSPLWYKLLYAWDFHLTLHIRLLCISFMWNMMPKLLFALPQLHGS
jgi:hypothetical protein